VHYRSTRGDGPLKIAAGLQPRRIAADLLKQALYENGPDWVQLCFEAMEKKFRQIGTEKPDQLQRVQRFLLQRGFTGEQVRAAVRLNRKD
jgi:regulatory protein